MEYSIIIETGNTKFPHLWQYFTVSLQS
jgi:hypothetical protein